MLDTMINTTKEYIADQIKNMSRDDLADTLQMLSYGTLMDLIFSAKDEEDRRTRVAFDPADQDEEDWDDWTDDLNGRYEEE